MFADYSPTSPAKSEMDFDEAMMSVDITEIFSPPRIAKQCEKMGLEPGSSMDLIT